MQNIKDWKEKKTCIHLFCFKYNTNKNKTILAWERVSVGVSADPREIPQSNSDLVFIPSLKRKIQMKQNSNKVIQPSDQIKL